MRRRTHLAAGALCTLPIAIDLPWQTAGGVVFLGVAGAVVPDYLDLRSDVRRILRHRGVSHSVFAGALAVGLVYLILRSLSRLDDQAFRLDIRWIEPLTAAFAIGLISHLVLDACTPGGISPVLPLSRRRLWLLPRSLRITTGSRIDSLIERLAMAAIVVVTIVQLMENR